MQTEFLYCPICSERYDITLRLPRIIHICGHTLCSQCILNLIKRPEASTCPVGKEVLNGDYSKLEAFPPNFTLRNLVENSLEFGLCQDHRKELQYICIEDKTKVCHECVLFGEHAGHNVKPLSDLKPPMEKRIQKLEEILRKKEEYHKKTEKLYTDQRNEALDLLRSRFKDSEYMLKVKEAECAYQIYSFYDKEMEKLRGLVGENSKARHTLKAKISEYEQITKQPNPFELLQEDFPVACDMIQEAIQLDKTDEIGPLLNKMNQEIDSFLDSQLSTLQTFRIPDEYFTNIEEMNIKLEEKLASREELEKNSPII